MAVTSNPRAAKDGGTISLTESNKPARKTNVLPESAKNVEPKFLGAETVKLTTSEPYRPVLAKWIASPSNPFFAKAYVNRLWAQFYGRGFVNPVDDMSNENTPSHPELLKALATEFANSGFDIKNLVRGICNSNTYQRTSRPVGDNRDDKTLFSHQAIKVLGPEQLYDSLQAVLGTLPGGGAIRTGKGGAQTPRDAFALFFMGTENSKPTDYEAGIPQVLRLMNNPAMATARLTNVVNTVGEISKNKTTEPAKVLEKLYLTTLARRPTADETKRLTDYIAKQADQKTAYADVLWVLLNSSEFALNR